MCVCDLNPRLLVLDVQGDSIYVVICDAKGVKEYSFFIYFYSLMVGKWNNMCGFKWRLWSNYLVFSTLKLNWKKFLALRKCRGI